MAPDDAPEPAPGAAHPKDAEAHEAPEHRIAGSPHATAANAALLALTRSARSFTLYDPANKIVRTLIADSGSAHGETPGGEGRPRGRAAAAAL